MTTPCFTRPDAWSGGSFEILIHLGATDQQRLKAALCRIWEHPALEGCWQDNRVEPGLAARVDPQALPLEAHSHFYGLACLPNGCEAPCSTYTVQDEDGDWLYFGIPLGSLGYCYEIGAYPFAETSVDAQQLAAWLRPLSDWLAEIGQFVYAEVPFPAAMTGFLTLVEVDELLNLPEKPVPEVRWHGILRQVRQRLEWYPPNYFEGPLVI